MHTSRLLALSVSVSGVVVGGVAHAQAPAADRSRPPNVVFILADDMGVMDPSCYGSTFHETPNIDRLAREGVRFTRAYAACPVCSPTRASILTGNYPTRTGVTDFINVAGNNLPEKWNRNTKMLPASHKLALSTDQTTLARMFKTQGYVTGSFGKWHLGGKGTMPTDHGFDANVAGNDAGTMKKFGPWQNLPGFDQPYTENDHIDEVVTDHAMQFITANKDKPFFVYVPYFEPHSKIETRPALEKKYADKLATLPQVKEEDRWVQEGPRRANQVQSNPIYAGMMETFDGNVGRLVRHIDSLGLGENTIIVFTSDNGGLSTSEGSPTSNVPFRAGKGWLYEGGVREPLVVRWTGKIAPGLSDQIITSPDFVPTLLELAGLPESTTALDGKSFTSALRGQPSDRGPVYWHYPQYGNQGSRPGSAVMEGRWKLIHWIEDQTWELYDLDTDQSEQKNLVTERADIVEQLKPKLEAFLKETGAKFPTPNPSYDPSKKDGRS
jgi:arylsulfatase A-like enzyme